MNGDDPIERLPKLFEIMRDAYKTLELEVKRLKKKASTMSGGLNSHDMRQMSQCVKSLTDLSKEERDLIKALKDVDPGKVKKLAGQLMQAKESDSEVVQQEEGPANVPGVPGGIRAIVRKAGGSGSSDPSPRG
jgi:hypothetical protein